MPILHEAIARGYASPKPKFVLFPRGRFFCESKILVEQIPKLGYTAVIVRLYLSSSATNGKPGIRIAKVLIKTIAKEDLKCSEKTVKRAICVLERHGFVLRKKKWFSLIEPPGSCSLTLPGIKKPQPRQLHLF